MASTKKVTGVRSAFVKIGDDQEVVVHHGEELPAGVTAEEVKRLDKLGVFGPTPRHLLPVDQRPTVSYVPGTATIATPAVADTAELEAANEQLRTELAETQAKLEAAAQQTPAPPVDTSDLEAAQEQLRADLTEANAKLKAAARLAPVVAGDLKSVNAYLADHPEDRDAIMFLERHGQKRKGVLDA